jgi:hypothetical protein
MFCYIKCLRNYSESVLPACAEKWLQIFVTNGQTAEHQSTNFPSNVANYYLIYGWTTHTN